TVRYSGSEASRCVHCQEILRRWTLSALMSANEEYFALPGSPPTDVHSTCREGVPCAAATFMDRATVARTRVPEINPNTLHNLAFIMSSQVQNQLVGESISDDPGTKLIA